MAFHVIDHTADVGIRVVSDSRELLFRDAAAGLYALIVDADTVQPSQEAAIAVDGTDDTDLLINWLRELLFLWTGKQLLVHGITSLEWNRHRIKARVTVDRFSPEHHHIINDIKAVTYHQAEVVCEDGTWTALIVCDV